MTGPSKDTGCLSHGTGCGRSYAPYTKFLGELSADKKWSIVNDGHDGQTTDWMFRHFATHLKQTQKQGSNLNSKPYDWILVLGGTNDLGMGKSAEDIIVHLKCIYGLAKKKGMKVLAFTIPEIMGEPFLADDEYIKRKNQVNEFIRTCPDVTKCVDLRHQVSWSDHATPHDIYDVDGLHFSFYGYHEMAKLTYQALLDSEASTKETNE